MNFYMWDRLDKNKVDCEIKSLLVWSEQLTNEEYLKVKDQLQSAQWLRGQWQGKQIKGSLVRFQDKLITNPFLETGVIKNHVLN